MAQNTLHIFACFNKAETEAANLAIKTLRYTVVAADPKGRATPLGLFAELGINTGATLEDVVVHLGAKEQAIPIPLPAGSTKVEIILATESV